MAGWPFPRRAAFAMFFLLTTGCWSVMSKPFDPSTEQRSAPNVFPLRFKTHAFAVHCYNTIRCKVVYADFDFGPYKADEQPSPPPTTPDYREHWGFASYAGIPNFPAPAQVQWTSLDGVVHEARVDIGAIFKDERVLYEVPDSEIPEGLFPQGLADTGVILEVNDRTINVYMKTLIPTKTEQIPGNKYSYGRDDVMLAWTRTY